MSKQINPALQLSEKNTHRLQTPSEIGAELSVLSAQVAEICRRYGVAELSVFGSAARGELRPESDVDLLVDFQPGVSHGLDYFGLEEELSKALGRPVDLATKKWLRPNVRAAILEDARILYAA